MHWCALFDTTAAACIYDVCDVILFERRSDVYHLQSMGAGAWGFAVVISIQGILEANEPEHV